MQCLWSPNCNHRPSRWPLPRDWVSNIHWLQRVQLYASRWWGRWLRPTCYWLHHRLDPCYSWMDVLFDRLLQCFTYSRSNKLPSRPLVIISLLGRLESYPLDHMQALLKGRESPRSFSSIFRNKFTGNINMKIPNIIAKPHGCLVFSGILHELNGMWVLFNITSEESRKIRYTKWDFAIIPRFYWLLRSIFAVTFRD